MSTNGRKLERLTLFDYSDRELLLIVMEQADASDDGFADTKTIADTLGIEGDRRLQSVGSRLAALKRFGVVERLPEVTRAKWQVTPIGRLMANGKVTKGIERSLEGISPEQTLLVTRYLTRRYREAPEAASHLIRREWVAGTHRYS